MEHTKLVTADDLEEFAQRRDSEPTIPELIFLLVNQSVPDLASCRIPYDGSVGLPGLDGRVESSSGFNQFVPVGVSYWEIGRSREAQAKATRDYRKRTDGTNAAERSNATFVFVTARSRDWDVASQSKWMASRKNDGWKAIRIIDGVQLCDWLREFPALGRWLLGRIGIPITQFGLSTPLEHWENLSSLVRPPDPPLTAQLFLEGRELACQHLSRLLEGETSQLLLLVDDEGDVNDFVAAFLQSMDPEIARESVGRCLFISEPSAWLAMTNLRSSHVLVASSRLDLHDSGEGLHLAARRRGHGIILPILGAGGLSETSIIHIKSPSQSALERVLLEGGFSSERASALASAGSRSLSRLKRYLLGLGDVPSYALSSNAKVTMQANLIGKWRADSRADIEALEVLLGKSYGEWIDAAQTEALRADAPLIKRNESWKVVARGEVWGALGARVTDDDLKRFKEVALRVLSEADPKFDVAADDRLVAPLYGRTLSHSRNLREGIAETLALLGSRGRELTFVTAGNAESVARQVVREILHDADWKQWASLNALIPLLAEAAPEEFLEATERAVADGTSEAVFPRLFAEEGGGPIGGQTYMSGVLWGLETLAWHPDYLGQVTDLLGELAALDPGGTWANRPKNSLADIYLPWHIQTVASKATRTAALESLRRHQPEIAWGVLLSLLPRAHGATTGTRKPIWRPLIPSGWNESVTNKDYWSLVCDYATTCIGIAAGDPPKLVQLVDRLSDIPEPPYSRFLDYLLSDAVTSLPDQQRSQLWEALKNVVSEQQRYERATPSQLDRLRQIVAVLEPNDIRLVNRRYFTERDWELYEERGEFEKENARIQQVRNEVVRRLLDSGGLQEVIQFAGEVEAPRKVGDALGWVDDASIDRQLLPSMLDAQDSTQQHMLSAYVWRRFLLQKWPWAASIIDSMTSESHKLSFLLLLPAEPEVWRNAEVILDASASRYWSAVRIYPWTMESGDLIEAAQKLTANGQADSAIDCLYLLSHKKTRIPLSLATETMLKAVNLLNMQGKSVDPQHTVDVISWLQECESLNSESLLAIEWAYVRWLTRTHGAEPKALEHTLASVPEFFCRVVATVFRSESEVDPIDDADSLARELAKNAYSLLHGWRVTPGTDANGLFDPTKFQAWLVTVKRLTAMSGHLSVALGQIGQALAHAPIDSGGLWIHESIAAALDDKDAVEMRRSFAAGLFNMRGIHGFTHGKEELRIADDYRSKAAALRERGYHRIADTVRRLAEDYQRDADREAQREPFDER